MIEKRTGWPSPHLLRSRSLVPRSFGLIAPVVASLAAAHACPATLPRHCRSPTVALPDARHPPASPCAPLQQLYYYNTETKESTYDRPLPPGYTGNDASKRWTRCPLQPAASARNTARRQHLPRLTLPPAPPPMPPPAAAAAAQPPSKKRAVGRVRVPGMPWAIVRASDNSLFYFNTVRGRCVVPGCLAIVCCAGAPAPWHLHWQRATAPPTATTRLTLPSRPHARQEEKKSYKELPAALQNVDLPAPPPEVDVVCGRAQRCAALPFAARPCPLCIPLTLPR